MGQSAKNRSPKREDSPINLKKMSIFEPFVQYNLQIN
jgi:hypothetical protein